VRFKSVFEGFRNAGDIIRALHIYDSDRSRGTTTGRLYGGLVRRGDLVLNIGDRAASPCRLLVCIELGIALGYTRVALGESQAFVNADRVDGEATVRWPAGRPHAANSGDIYATSA
jgi:hypothetical protein